MYVSVEIEIEGISFNTGLKRYQQIEHFDTTLLSC